MSIKLPAMRMLCYRWMLPQTIAEACDYYFLDRPSFPDFANSLQMKEGKLTVQRHGVDFEAVFQNAAECLYTACVEKELQGDPCVQVTFWCSFRSLTFEWAGVTHTRSVVLVQPAREKVRSREPAQKLAAHAARYGMGVPRFADKLNITEEQSRELLKEYQDYLQSIRPAEFPSLYMQEPAPTPAEGFGGVNYKDLIGTKLVVTVKTPTTFADRVANSLDKMENENDPT